MRMVAQAYAIAWEAHAGQVDKGGRPYIEHPKQVAEAFQDERLQAVAYLHDVVEDTPISFEMLRQAGLPWDVLEAVEAITKRPGEAYTAYLERVKANPLSLLVKLVDIKHNMDMGRIPNPTEKDWGRLQRYEKAYRFLTE